MLKLYFFVFAAVCLSACNNSIDANKKNSDTIAGQHSTNQVDGSTAQPATVAGCYMRVLQRDTLVAHLQQTGNAVSGRLTFDNFEKDGSTGEVSGTLEDGILKLVYTFQSEGMTSKREVRFKKVDNGLLMGIGDMRDKDGTSIFTNPSAIEYSGTEKLTTIDCGSVPSKYK